MHTIIDPQLGPQRISTFSMQRKGPAMDRLSVICGMACSVFAVLPVGEAYTVSGSLMPPHGEPASQGNILLARSCKRNLAQLVLQV